MQSTVSQGWICQTSAGSGSQNENTRGALAGGRSMRVSRLLLIFSVLASAAARGDPWQHEFLLLPSVSTVGTFDRHAPETQIVDEVVQADMIFSLQKGPFKVFGEYLRSDHEGDLE